MRRRSHGGIEMKSILMETNELIRQIFAHIFVHANRQFSQIKSHLKKAFDTKEITKIE